MKTTIFVCPFALFGNSGTAAGAELVADALHEMLDDNRRENRPHRAAAYAGQVAIKELPLKNLDDVSKWQGRARVAASKALDGDDFLIWIGGNHLSVMPVYQELVAREGSLALQLDAHLDLYHLKDNVPELSHGNFLRSLDPRPSIVNVGHRDVFLTDTEIRKHYQSVHSIADFVRDEPGICKGIVKQQARAKRVFVDIDCDVIDPAFFPAVVDGLPFGLTPQQTLRLIDAVDRNKFCGIAFSEFDSGRDIGDRSLGLLIWLIEYVLLRQYED